MTTKRTARTCTNVATLASGEQVMCGRRAANPMQVSGHQDLCERCFESWMMENDHNDYGHDEPVADCPECGTYDPRPAKGHTNTRAKSRTSHAACEHPKTPKDRAACRKRRAQGK